MWDCWFIAGLRGDDADPGKGDAVELEGVQDIERLIGERVVEAKRARGGPLRSVWETWPRAGAFHFHAQRPFRSSDRSRCCAPRPGLSQGRRRRRGTALPEPLPGGPSPRAPKREGPPASHGRRPSVVKLGASQRAPPNQGPTEPKLQAAAQKEPRGWNGPSSAPPVYVPRQVVDDGPARRGRPARPRHGPAGSAPVKPARSTSTTAAGDHPARPSDPVRGR